jgi:hypothetical protein
MLDSSFEVKDEDGQYSTMGHEQAGHTDKPDSKQTTCLLVAASLTLLSAR